MKQSKQKLKTYFETGDKPTEGQYSDLIDSYVDSKQEKGDSNRRFVIDADGDVIVTSEQKIPEYSFSEVVNNTFSLLKDGVAIKEIDLTNYIDDTNLSRLISGSVAANGMATFTRDDDSIFEVNFNNFLNTIEGKIPEYTFSEITGNKLALLKDGVAVKEIDLSIYLDDTNLSRLVSGNVDVNGVATFTRDDNTTFTINFSDLISPQVQANWNETDNSQPNYIENKPVNLSDFNNDTDFITKKDIPEIQAGTNITIDNTDPLKPVINSAATANTPELPSIISNSSTIAVGRNVDNDYILTDSNNLQTVADRGSVILNRDIFLNVSGTDGINARYSNEAVFWTGRGTFSNLNTMIGVTGFNLNGKLLTRKDENPITIYFPEKDYGTDSTKNEIALKGDIPILQEGTGVTIDNTDPLKPIVNSSGVSDGLPSDFTEEGTWVPELSYSSTSGSFHSLTANYTRIGNMVSFYIQLNEVNLDPSGGSLKITVPSHLPRSLKVFTPLKPYKLDCGQGAGASTSPDVLSIVDFPNSNYIFFGGAENLTFKSPSSSFIVAGTYITDAYNL